jgi:hypothetical protein
MRGEYWEAWPWCHEWCSVTQPAISPSPSTSSVGGGGGIHTIGGGYPTTGSVDPLAISRNNPILWIANNIGPWTGSRSGFNCPSGGTYGNGTFAWALASPTGSFPYWSGPLFSLRCLSDAKAVIQTWTMTVSGWSYCQRPSYTSTSTKSASDDVVFFQIGAGNLTIQFV